MVDQGETYTSPCQIYDEFDELIDPDSISLNVIDPDGTTILSNQTPIKEATGRYYYDYTFQTSAMWGSWIFRWTAIVDSIPYSGDDVVSIESRTIPTVLTSDKKLWHGFSFSTLRSWIKKRAVPVTFTLTDASTLTIPDTILDNLSEGTIEFIDYTSTPQKHALTWDEDSLIIYINGVEDETILNPTIPDVAGKVMDFVSHFNGINYANRLAKRVCISNFKRTQTNIYDRSISTNLHIDNNIVFFAPFTTFIDGYKMI